MKEIVLTGDRPTGPLHVGHYVGSLKNRVKLQNEHTQFVMIADIQGLTDNFENPKKIQDNLLEVFLDNLAVGVDPNKTTFFIQSAVPELTELTIYYLNLVTVARLERNPTVKNEIQQKNFEKALPAGFLCYPVSQAADITAFKATMIPVGNDQLPMIEQTNEIVRRFNHLYPGNVLVEAKPLLSPCSRLCGIDGNEKMGKSLGNAIYIKDDEKILTQKVMQMFTDPNHINVSDPGRVEGNTVFTYLDVFDSNRAEVQSLKEHYMRGGLGDVSLKKRLASLLIEELKPIQLKRAEFEKDRGELIRILQKGTEHAREIAAQTLKEVRQAIGVNYFDE